MGRKQPDAKGSRASARNAHRPLFVSKPQRRRVRKTATPTRPWMSVLAAMAAASRVDGGEGLCLLLHRARWTERTRMSLTKREAA